MRAAYTSPAGRCYHGDCLEILPAIPAQSVNLVCTSPPYPLRREKEYGNVTPERYVEWFMPIAREVWRVLRPDGSFVVELGGAWNVGNPTRSLMSCALLCELVGSGLFHLAHEHYWHNTRALPTPIEWACKARVRCKDTVTPIWWLSKDRQPYADNRAVLVPYARPGARINGGEHPSGHNISPESWQRDNGGAVPGNCFVMPGVGADDYYRRCKAAGHDVHPARQPPQIPDFFIRMLTRPRELVLDPFAGSNTTGKVAEDLGRRWVSVEIVEKYVEASKLRFAGDDSAVECNHARNGSERRGANA